MRKPQSKNPLTVLDLAIVPASLQSSYTSNHSHSHAGNARSQQESKPLNPSAPFPGRNESLSQTADFAVRALQAVAANVAILAEDAELRVGRLADDVGALGQDIQGGVPTGF